MSGTQRDPLQAPPVQPAPSYLEFSSGELLELAIRLERAGTEFYRALMEETADPACKDFFLHLLGEEMHHERELRVLFRELTDRELDRPDLSDGLTGRAYLGRLREAAQQRIFPDSFELLSDPGAFRSLDEGLRVALRAEQQSISLYAFLARVKTAGDARDLIEQLRRDEEEHLEDVKKLMARLSGRGA